MKTTPLLLALVLLTGCYTMKYLPYTGDQQTWPTATGSFMQTNAAVPVYYGLPPKPYRYLAQIHVNAESSSVDAVSVAAAEARKQGAHAVLILSEGQRYGGSVGASSGTAYQFPGQGNFASGFGSSVSSAQYLSQCQIIAIQFTNPADVPALAPVRKTKSLMPSQTGK